MKWTILAAMIGLTTGCCNMGVVEYQQVSVVPVKKVVRVIPVRRVVTQIVTPVVEPVLVDYVEPIDVTTATIDFY